MSLEPDIVSRVENDFSHRDASHVINALNASGKVGRIARCIVFCARGSLEAFNEFLEMADQDYRDVILAAEYDYMDQPLRHLSASFLIDSPEMMWISPVADALLQREYYLTSVKPGPMDSGIATFEGDLGEITVTKDRSQWILKGDKEELEQHKLWKAFDDVSNFTDELSSYILAKRLKQC